MKSLNKEFNMAALLFLLFAQGGTSGKTWSWNANSDSLSSKASIIHHLHTAGGPYYVSLEDITDASFLSCAFYSM